MHTLALLGSFFFALASKKVRKRDLQRAGRSRVLIFSKQKHKIKCEKANAKTLNTRKCKKRKWKLTAVIRLWRNSWWLVMERGSSKRRVWRTAYDCISMLKKFCCLIFLARLSKKKYYIYGKKNKSHLIFFTQHY